MSKVICDICGTSYADTAAQCPICGSVRPVDSKVVIDDKPEAGTAGYNHVKGGRFSKSNVRKRNKTKPVVKVNVVSEMKPQDKKSGKSNTALSIVAVILLLAVIAVVIYIALTYFGDPPQKGSSNQGATQSTEQTEDLSVPCTEIKLYVVAFELDAVGSARMLGATVSPENTTDQILYTCDNENVATVNESGIITAVAPGTATITVTCGQIQETCTVTCNFEDPNAESTEPSEDPTEESTVPTIDPNAELKLNRRDITFSSKDDSWMLYSGSLPVAAITWTSDNEAVATIENGEVVAAGAGTTNVHGEYGGVKVSCIIRCNFDNESNSGVEGSGGNIGEDGGGTGSTGGAHRLYNPYGNAEDVSITVGYSFTLSVVDGSGNPVSGVTWASGNDAVATVSNGKITGAGSGTTVITASYNGENFSCTVRVSGS